MIVAGAGTGGTLTGLARKLKEKVPNITVRCNFFPSSSLRPRFNLRLLCFEIFNNFFPSSLMFLLKYMF